MPLMWLRNRRTVSEKSAVQKMYITVYALWMPSSYSSNYHSPIFLSLFEQSEQGLKISCKQPLCPLSIHVQRNPTSYAWTIRIYFLLAPIICYTLIENLQIVCTLQKNTDLQYYFDRRSVPFLTILSISQIMSL